jgi:hypothetical protein
MLRGLPISPLSKWKPEVVSLRAENLFQMQIVSRVIGFRAMLKVASERAAKCYFEFEVEVVDPRPPDCTFSSVPLEMIVKAILRAAGRDATSALRLGQFLMRKPGAFREVLGRRTALGLFRRAARRNIVVALFELAGVDEKWADRAMERGVIDRQSEYQKLGDDAALRGERYVDGQARLGSVEAILELVLRELRSTTADLEWCERMMTFAGQIEYNLGVGEELFQFVLEARAGRVRPGPHVNIMWIRAWLLSRPPEDPAGLYGRAVELISMGRRADAEGLAIRAAAAGNVLAMRTMSFLLADQAGGHSALPRGPASLRVAAEVASRRAIAAGVLEAWHDLAGLLFVRGDLRGAKEALMRGVKVEQGPAGVQAAAFLALVCGRLGESDECRRWLKKAGWIVNHCADEGHAWGVLGEHGRERIALRQGLFDQHWGARWRVAPRLVEHLLGTTGGEVDVREARAVWLAFCSMRPLSEQC